MNHRLLDAARRLADVVDDLPPLDELSPRQARKAWERIDIARGDIACHASFLLDHLAIRAGGRGVEMTSATAPKTDG